METRSAPAVTAAVRLGDRLAHPAAGLHRRVGLVHRRAGRLHLVTGRDVYFRLSGFWTRLFAVSFGMGVVSGIIMPFQFGTKLEPLLRSRRGCDIADAGL